MNKVFPAIQPNHLYEQMNGNQQSVALLDVRTSEEFARGHADGASSIPLDELDTAAITRRFGQVAGTKEPLYLICQAGMRAEQAAARLNRMGLHKLVLVKGGTAAWQSCNLPMQRLPSNRWYLPSSPQAQVEWFFGLLIVAFAVKGLLLHPAFMLVVAFAGVTMAMSASLPGFSLVRLVAELPWNRHQPS